jgi:hypothetical protein
MTTELDFRAGDFGWIASVEALAPLVTSLCEITGVLRAGAADRRELLGVRCAAAPRAPGPSAPGFSVANSRRLSFDDAVTALAPARDSR